MDGPGQELDVGGARVVLVGTIAGFVPDAARVQAAWDRLRPTALALGVPEEDVATLAAIHDADAAGQARPELPEVDLHTERLFELLGRWGATRVPSPELEAAYARARADGIPVHALDLGDLEHAERFTQRVKFRHIVRSNAIQSRLLKKGLPEQPDPYALAAAWDHELSRVKPFAQLEREREAEMARRLAELAAAGARVLAVVPSPRLAGVAAALEAAGAREAA